PGRCAGSWRRWQWRASCSCSVNAQADARGLDLTQRKTGVADLHQQGFGTEWTGGDNPHFLSRNEPELAQTACHRVVWREVFDVLDDGRGAPGELVQSHAECQMGIVRILASTRTA